MAYALITGASGGIGKELAFIYAENGYDLILAARNEQALNNVTDQIERNFHKNVLLFSTDLTDENAPDEIHKALCEKEIYPEVLVNNAGFGDKSAFVNSDWSRQENMVKLNILALMKMTHIFGRDMKARGNGKILNISSVAAFSGGPNMSIYYASKAFVLSFSQSVNAELKPYGVTVTALCPGPTLTEFEKAAQMKGSSMFSLFPQTAKDVAKAGYKACADGKAVKYHSPVTYGFNVLSRLLPRSTVLKLAQRVNGK